jgi:type IX secretion system PorP/SprF family membrane protein
MKNILTVLLITGVVIISGAQSFNQGLIQSTQFPVNTYMINPAYAGAEEYTSFQAAYKKNYLLPSAPQTIYLSGFTRLETKAKINVKREIKRDTTDQSNFSLPVRGRSVDKYKKRLAEKQDSMKIMQMQDELDYQKRITEAKDRLKTRPYHGIGANLINESSGSAGGARTGVDVTYAYHISLTKKIRWAFGASVGFGSYTSPNIGFRDQSDPFAANGAIQGNIVPDLNLGTYIYHDRFYIGLSAMSLIPMQPYQVSKSFGSLPALTGNVVPIFLATAGYKIKIDDDISVTPSVLTRYINGFSLITDINARLNYKTVWGGLTYRSGGTTPNLMSVMIGINLARVFDVSYSYDLNFGAIGKATGPSGGHEIILGYRLQRGRGSLKSRMFN